MGVSSVSRCWDPTCTPPGQVAAFRLPEDSSRDPRVGTAHAHWWDGGSLGTETQALPNRM